MDEWSEFKAEQAADWLEHVRRLEHDAATAQDRVDVLRSLALPSGIDYSLPSVKSSPSADAIPNAVAKLVDAIGDYVDKLDAYATESIDAAKRLQQIGDSRYRDVLTLYYVNGRTWEKVGEVLGYVPDHCRRLRNEALPLVYDIMPREWRTMIPRAD